MFTNHVIQMSKIVPNRVFEPHYISFLPPTYIVCGKVIFSHMFICQSVKLWGGGSHVNFAHDALGHSIVVYKSIIG